MQKWIQIKQCSDNTRWYAKYIGYSFSLRYEYENEYEVRQPEGYINFILKKDAELVMAEDLPITQDKSDLLPTP